MTPSIEELAPLPGSPESALAEQRSLPALLSRRVAVEREFARLGHTYRHGKFYRRFEHHVTRPALKFALKATGLYERGVRNAQSPVIREISLRFPSLPDKLDGFQILHLSDFHIEGVPGLVDALIPLLRSLRPDVCVLTGDFRFEDHGPCEPVFPLMQALLSSVRPRFGSFGILGNHDTAEIAVRMERIGVRMLINEAVPLGDSAAPLWLIGVDDPFDYQCHDLARAQSSVPPASFKVLLAHAPEIYDEAAGSGIDLYLSGHTHGGQIRLPVLGAIRRNARCPSAFAYGHWSYKGLQGYTSPGIGCSSLPVRFGCPPEVVLITLRSALPSQR